MEPLYDKVDKVDKVDKAKITMEEAKGCNVYNKHVKLHPM